MALVRTLVVPNLVREAVDRGWWAPLGDHSEPDDGPRSRDWAMISGIADDGASPATIVPLERGLLDRVRFAERVAPLR
ncbi:MAG: hypothetical protein C4343_05420, partial [Chloroflexota bacterium]